MSCPGRHHNYGPDGKCRRCGDPKRGPGRPTGSGGKKKLGAEVLGRMTGTVGSAALPGTASPPVAVGPSSSPASSGPATTTVHPPSPTGAANPGLGATAEPKGDPPPSVKPNAFHRRAGARLATMFVAVTEWGIEKTGRQPGEPDEDDVEDFGEAMGEQLAIWLPNVELTPGKQLALAATFIAGEMIATSKKLPPREPPKQLPPSSSSSPSTRAGGPALAVVPAPAAATITDATAPLISDG